jgi:uncharacterized membrane protein
MIKFILLKQSMILIKFKHRKKGEKKLDWGLILLTGTPITRGMDEMRILSHSLIED